MTMHIPPAIAIVMAMTVSLGTTIILCNGTTMMAVSVSAFAFSSSVLRRHPAAHPPHRGTVTGRRRRRPLSPPSSTDAATTTIKTTPISHQHLFLLNSSNNDNENNSAAAESVDTNNPADELLNKARRLRQEISTIESSKLQAQNEKDIQVQAKLAAEEADRQQNEQARLRYSAIVPILKDMGEEVLERVDFPPRVKGGESCIVTVQAPLPLGLILSEESATPGLIYVDSLSPDGNGFNAGIQEGDILRAITACKVTMESPTWQLLAGGIGRPKTKRFMYVVDGRPLEEVLDAVGSNRMDSLGRDVWLVLERMQ